MLFLFVELEVFDLFELPLLELLFVVFLFVLPLPDVLDDVDLLEELLHEVGKRFSRVITVENGVIKGGLGSAVLEFMADNGYAPQVKRIGVPDEFVEHGSIPELYKLCGMDAKSIAGEIKKMVIRG